MGVAGLFFAVALLTGGAKYDAATHRLEAHGAAAADWNAPSAQVARVAAERAARQRAEAALTAGLKALHCGVSDEERATLAKSAEPRDQRYGSDGSVELDLALSTAELRCKK